MGAVRAPVTPEVLSWARLQAGLSTEQVAKRLRQRTEAIEEWEDGARQPTLNQLRTLAGLYRRTVAFFFLQEPPRGDEIERPPDFRARPHAQISSAVLREISKADERRKYYIELSEQSSIAPIVISTRTLPDGVTPDHLSKSPDSIAASIRESLAVSTADQVAWSTHSEALSGWIYALERAGFLIFHMSRIDLSECRGLSLYREPYPIIILNGAEDQNARIFTLMHELAHLITHASGICDVWTKNRIEQQCNAFAGALLLPREAFLRALGKAEPVESISRLASHFAVSQSAVAVRLKDFGFVTQREVDRQLEIAGRVWSERRERQKARASKGGPPHHKIHLRNLGGNYVSAVLQAMDNEAISPVDATYLLEAKLQTVERMRSELLSGEDILSSETVA